MLPISTKPYSKLKKTLQGKTRCTVHMYTTNLK
uniref:Uncharacterized protein n=1 Tax=Arundo donax TaxID=35708 RepID=A0A0A8ZPS8_ARUDO